MSRWGHIVPENTYEDKKVELRIFYHTCVQHPANSGHFHSHLATSNYYQASIKPVSPILPPGSSRPVISSTLPKLVPELDNSNIKTIEKRLNNQIDPAYSFKYDKRFSSKEESTDTGGNIKGYSEVPQWLTHSQNLNYKICLKIFDTWCKKARQTK